MLYDSKLKKQIITNPTAEYIVDNVSPVYGDSFVGLHIFNLMGMRIEGLIKLCESIGLEANPITATGTLDMWEDSLGLARNPNLTIKERRERILNHKLSRMSSNPYKLKKIIKDITGLDSEIIENTDEYTFRIKVKMGNAQKAIISNAFREIDTIKHAHIVYDFTFSYPHDMYVGIGKRRLIKRVLYPYVPGDQRLGHDIYVGTQIVRRFIKRTLKKQEVSFFDAQTGSYIQVTTEEGDTLTWGNVDE